MPVVVAYNARLYWGGEAFASWSKTEWRFTTLSVEATRAASNAPESISKSRQPTFG